jgi:hypothetical protein
MRETALIRKFSTVITTPVHPGGSDPSSVVHAEEDLTLFSYVLTGLRRRSANVDHIQSADADGAPPTCGPGHQAVNACGFVGTVSCAFVGNVFGI